MLRLRNADEQTRTNNIQCETLFLKYCLDIDQPASAPPSRSCISKFILHVKNIHSNGKDVLVCAERDCKYVTSAAVLVGSYMILSDGIGMDDVLEQLASIPTNFVSYDDGIGLVDCLSAIEKSKSLGWLNTPEISAGSANCQASDTIRQIIPGRLLFCPNQGTAMASRTDQASDCLSAAHRAIALADLDVCLVLRIGRPLSSAAASSLRAQGIAVEDLPLDGGVHLLHAFDTLLTIVRNAPRPIAVEGTVSSVAPLIAACLMREGGFTAGAAMAWVRMARPGSPSWTTAAPALLSAGAEANQAGGLDGTVAGGREVGGTGACMGRDAPASRARWLVARSRSCASLFAT